MIYAIKSLVLAQIRADRL